MTAAEYGAEEGLARLGDAVEARISEEGLQYTEVAERAGFSDETLSKIRKGVRVSPVTYRKLERAIGWTAHSADTVKAGGDPTVDPDRAAPAAPAEDDPIDPQAAAVLTILDSLPQRVQEEVLRRLGDRIPPGARRTA